MLQTKFTELLGCTVPLQQAGGGKNASPAPAAVAAEKAGCDLIVAQGTEAGGHVRGKIGLMALLSEVLPSVKVPVVAAGGIGPGGPWPQPSRPAPRQYGWARGSSLRRRRGPIP